MRVPEIPYERYTIEMCQEAFARFEKAAQEAKSAEELLAAREAFLEEQKRFSTAASLANCRFTLNTRDPYYTAEMEYYDTIMPQVSEISVKYGEIMLSTPYRAEMEKVVNPLCYLHYELHAKTYSPEVEEDCREENAVVTEYSKLLSSITVELDGKTLPLSFARGFLDSSDREVRKNAAYAIGEALRGVSEQLDGIYDRLVKIRTRIARKLGYENYIELGYYRMGRIDYNREMVAKFRANVKEALVPVVSKIKADLAREMGLDAIHFYDDAVYISGGNPRPRDTAEGIFANAQQMYDEMKPEIGDFMRRMLENEAFDVEAREGKVGGGYCTGFDIYEQPFILANFNGTAGDIDVITHEFGHALAAENAYREGEYELGVGSMETAECHSMSMEFFCEPFMDKFFDDPKGYCRQHLLSSLSFIPYGVIVDEFQHIVYENPDMTPAERKEAYLALEEKYRPYLDWKGIPYLEEGTRWQYQSHIYETPFYYIDYCLAQTVALGFFVMMQEDYGKALDKYLTFLKAGGTKKFSALVREAGIADPFGEGTLGKMADKLLELLDR